MASTQYGYRGTYVKAARKVNIEATDSESEEDSDDDGQSDSSSSTSQQSRHQPAEDSDEEYELDVKQEEHEAPLLRPFGPPELIVLDSPPPVTIPLPQIASEYSKATFPPRLVTALSALALASVHLQEARRVPFLLRNLRKGFLHRCKSLGISMVKDVGNISLSVRYQHVDNIHHEVLLRRWRCPICSLHGKFANQGVLAKHLAWDHAELFVEWEKHKTTSVSTPFYLV